MRNRLVEGKEPFEQSGPMGKGKRAKKRRPFLEEDDDVEQSEERPSKKSRLESSDIIKKYKDLQKAQEVNEKSYLRTLEERVAALERENDSLRNALSIIEGEVKSVFKENTEVEIKGYIRQKLSNSAKILKRKTF
ncbi:hypothetical protein OYC64_005136 [Pagothenia borchgrevinki]|uniref:Uncharacterized protein n=1 Tax=Pagothenia borchgrevinki TaxID=8213 RepID=A0ABD2GEJ1_PAGBO